MFSLETVGEFYAMGGEEGVGSDIESKSGLGVVGYFHIWILIVNLC